MTDEKYVELERAGLLLTHFSSIEEEEAYARLFYRFYYRPIQSLPQK